MRLRNLFRRNRPEPPAPFTPLHLYVFVHDSGQEWDILAPDCERALTTFRAYTSARMSRAAMLVACYRGGW